VLAVERGDCRTDGVADRTRVRHVLGEDDEPLDLADGDAVAGVVVGEFGDAELDGIADVDGRLALLCGVVGPSRRTGLGAAPPEKPDYQQPDEAGPAGEQEMSHTETLDTGPLIDCRVGREWCSDGEPAKRRTVDVQSHARGSAISVDELKLAGNGCELEYATAATGNKAIGDEIPDIAGQYAAADGVLRETRLDATVTDGTETVTTWHVRTEWLAQLADGELSADAFERTVTFTD